ncbi:hypothetical protein [Nostoc sp. NMS8]|uniref:hypothetical protein n=1 Tax=Nostoc sp. NMS8 TaxID=2815392 RepID=UPI0025DD7F6D|nr:hypothetical protein [Nostoc sp. NMS8]MBN3957386.1 hypothetical protein [Nostoc sp. NMS8]
MSKFRLNGDRFSLGLRSPFSLQGFLTPLHLHLLEVAQNSLDSHRNLNLKV